MREDYTNLGSIIKKARIKANLTQGKVAEKVGAGERHITALENEGHNPGYDLLYNIIRELNIDANAIFFPEKAHVSTETEYLINHLYRCNK